MGQPVEWDTRREDDTERRYLTFWTDGQLFGVSITDVVQIVGLQEMTELPDYPDYVKGIINLRGQMILLIDVRLRFGKAEIPYNDRTCIIIIHVGHSNFGLIVDEVDEVTDISPDKIAPPPKVNTEQIDTYLTGIAQLAGGSQKDRIALLLHTAKILGETELSVQPQTVRG